MNIIDKPLSAEELRKEANENGCISAIISLSLNDIIDNDLEGVFDIMSEAVTGSPLMMDIGYELVGSSPDGTLYLRVTGDVSNILNDDDGNKTSVSFFDITDIDWDTTDDDEEDDDDEEIELPSRVIITREYLIRNDLIAEDEDDDEDILDQISDFLSNEFGFCHRGFNAKSEEFSSVDFDKLTSNAEKEGKRTKIMK